MASKSEFIDDLTLVIQPDWLVPIDSQPIELGYVVLKGNTLLYWGRELPKKFQNAASLRLLGHAILPGLINAHCHLEFSDLPEPIAAEGSFAEWIQAVIQYRSQATNSPIDLNQLRQESIRKGIEESYHCGVRWIVDMTTQPWNRNWLESSTQALTTEVAKSLGSSWSASPGLFIQPCIELIDVTTLRLHQTRSFAEEQMMAGPNHDGTSVGKIGLAPHAPYTASLELVRWSQGVSKAQERLVSMHLAESTAEIQWLTQQQGPFADLFRPIATKEYFERLSSIETRVASLCESWRSLIVHGNFLTTNELSVISNSSKVAAIVHCPRTHQHFGHQHDGRNEYPFAERLRLGVRHFLGTDSRASNPNLNLWQEAQTLRATSSSLSSRNILQMITTDAADFLQLPKGVGTFQDSCPAMLTSVELTKSLMTSKARITESPDALYDALLASDTESRPLEQIVVARESQITVVVK